MDRRRSPSPAPGSRSSTALTAGLLFSSFALLASAACNGPGVIIATTDTASTTSGVSTTTGSGPTSTTSSGGESSGTSLTDTGTDDSETSAGETSTLTGEESCQEGVTLCVDGDAKTCDGMGGYSDVEECVGPCLGGECGLCKPNKSFCDVDGNAAICAPDGMSVKHLTECDPVQGMQCVSGTCSGDCSYTGSVRDEGCDFYPTVTANVVSAKFSFAVAVANAGETDVMIQIDGGGESISAVAAAKSVLIVKRPWIEELKAEIGATSATVVGGAYRLRSDHPVSVYQYSSLENTIGEASSRSADATRIFPVNSWKASHLVASYNTWRSANATYYPGFYTVTAAEDETTVELHPSATGGIVRAGGGVALDGTGTITLNRGDVLQVLSAGTGPNPVAADLTGTLVTADKDVQVIGGHMCAAIPYDAAGCDHLEAVMPGTDELYETSYVTAPLDHLGEALRPQRVRIIAQHANTAIEYDPPQEGAPTEIAAAGDYVEIEATAENFRVEAYHVLVGQYMLGQGVLGGPGDPSMSIANVGGNAYIASDFFVHAPTSFEKSFVSILTPVGGTVMIDGVTVDGFVPIGVSDTVVGRFELSNGGDGHHRIESSWPAAIEVYGYGQYTSYRFRGPYGTFIMGS